MALTHHKLLPGNPAVIESEKPIIFLMDDIKEDPEEEPPKKKKKRARRVRTTKVTRRARM